MSLITKIIPVTAEKVVDTLVNYPALIKPSVMTGWRTLTLAEAQSLRFYTDLTKTVELAREVVSADEIHVKVPSFTNATTLVCEYDGVASDYAATDPYGRNNVWSDYYAVWHFNQAPTVSAPQIADATGNGLNVTANGAMDGADHIDGPFAKAWAFDGSDDYGQIAGTPANFQASQVSITSWLKRTTLPTSDSGFGLYISNAASPFSQLVVAAGGYLFFRTSASTVPDVQPTTPPTANQWNYFAGTIENGSQKVYLNGAANGSETGAFDTTMMSSVNASYFARQAYNGNLTPQLVDIAETRYRKTILSDSWIETEYNNQAGVATFWGIVEDSVATTSPVTNITKVTATANGEIINDLGYTITERGVCWSTTTNPTINDGKVIVAGTIGVFSGEMTGLSINTTYHVRVYAINALGIFYGENETFTTLDVLQYEIVLDINAEENTTYQGRINVTGTTGSVTVQLGSTGTSTVINAGTGVTSFLGTYSGLFGIIITRSADFNGTVDDVYYAQVPLGTVVNWSLDNATILSAIDSSVFFKRIEDDVFNSYRFYRYLDLLFKDLDGYVTVTVRDERDDISTEREKTFSVGNTESGTVSPFQKKRVAFLIKSQAIIIGVSNASLNETFSIAKFVLSGDKKDTKFANSDKIISVT
jgi:hypothetical protein